MSVASAIRVYRGYRSPRFRIIEHRKWWFILSGSLIALSLIGLFVRGLNYSIEFTGGTQLVYPIRAGLTAEQVRSTFGDAGLTAEVQIVGGDTVSVRTESLTDLSIQERTDLVDSLAKQAGVVPEDVSLQVVGPTWGGEISRKAIQGLIIVLIAITVYIAFRFEWKMAIGAQVAMLHDVVITAGIYALTGREVSPATVIAILTILGYSLYDTVVIYDKIKENTESPAMLAKDTYAGVVNESLNHVFMRSVNTSLVVILPILSLLLFGGSTLKDFAFAMLIGVTVGAYSSIFVASPLLVVLKQREPKYQALAQRAAAREAVGKRQRPAPVDTGDGEVAATTATAAAAAAAGATAGAAATRTTARAGGTQRPKSKRKPPAKRRRR